MEGKNDNAAVLRRKGTTGSHFLSSRTGLQETPALPFLPEQQRDLPVSDAWKSSPPPQMKSRAWENVKRFGDTLQRELH